MSSVLVNATEIVKLFQHNHNNFVQTSGYPHRLFNTHQVQTLFKKALMDSIDIRCYWANPLDYLEKELNRLFPELEILETASNTIRDKYLVTVLDQLLMDVENFTDIFLPNKTWKYVDIVQKGSYFGLHLGEDYRVLEYHRLHGGNPW